ncbi:MAG: hypothetical protein ACLQOO_04300 [Terriglobia bacterium]
MEEQREAMERAAEQEAEQAARQEELLERQREAIEEAAEQHRTTTANAWKLQAEAKSERAYALYQSGMFEEAYKLAVQSIEQDPGNLDGFWVAASSLLSSQFGKGQTRREPRIAEQFDRARPYLEKQIQLLNLSEYRSSPRFFVQVLDLLSIQRDLFLLGDAFSSTLRANIGNWRRSGDSAEKARRIMELLADLERFCDAQCVLEFDLQGDPRSIKALNSAVALLKKVIARGDTATANKIVNGLSEKSQSLITETYLCEMLSLLGKDGKGRLDAFLQKQKMDSRPALEADLAQIKQLSSRGEIRQETLDSVMRSVRERYGQWKATVEAQLRDTVVASAKSVKVESGGLGIGFLSFFLLILAPAAYYTLRGFSFEFSAYLFWGAVFGGILIGALYGRYKKRSWIAQETRTRLAAAFNGENKRYAELGLPTLTPPTASATQTQSYENYLYVAIVVSYIVCWLSMMTSQGRTLTDSASAPTSRLQRATRATEELPPQFPPFKPTLCDGADGEDVRYDKTDPDAHVIRIPIPKGPKEGCESGLIYWPSGVNIADRTLTPGCVLYIEYENSPMRVEGPWSGDGTLGIPKLPLRSGSTFYPYLRVEMGVRTRFPDLSRCFK